jgi:hypothetical protein
MHVGSITGASHKDPVQLLALGSGRQEIGSAVMLSKNSGHAVITVAPEKQQARRCGKRRQYFCNQHMGLILSLFIYVP